MIKFIHGADFHLDAPFAALPPDRAAQRRGEQRALLERFADLAQDQQVDLVLLAGDLLDGQETYTETIQALARTLGSIPAPVFLSPGNHDFWSAHSPYAAAWPENVHIFSAQTPQAVPLPQLGCVVYGAAFCDPACGTSPLKGFHAPEDGNISLMVLHGEVGSGGNYGPLSKTDIADSGLTYLALGHVHSCSGLQQTGDTWWAYPGCPEGRGFDEAGDKGVLLGTINNGVVSTQFVPLAARRYLVKTVDVTGRAPEEALADFLPQTPSPDLCRIVFTGACTGLPLPTLEAIAAPCYYSVNLQDRTHMPLDLWRRAKEDTLTGLFLRAMRQRLDSTQSEEGQAQIQQAVRFGLAALEHREDPFG